MLVFAAMKGRDAGARRVAEDKASTCADFFVDKKWLCRHHRQDEGWDEFETLLPQQPSSEGGDSILSSIATVAVRKSSSWVRCRRKAHDEQQQEARDDEEEASASTSRSARRSKSMKWAVAWQDGQREPEEPPPPLPVLARTGRASIAEFPPMLSSKEIEEKFSELRFREAALLRVVADIKAIGSRKDREAYFRALQEELEAMARELENNATTSIEASSTLEDHHSSSSGGGYYGNRGGISMRQAKNESHRPSILTSFSSHMSDTSESGDPTMTNISYWRTPGKRVRPARRRRNTDRNYGLKPCISSKGTAPVAAVVLEKDPSFYTDVTHSISNDSDLPSYDHEDSTGDSLVMLSKAQMNKESPSMQSTELLLMDEQKRAKGVSVQAVTPATPTTTAAATAFSEINFAQLAADFSISRTRMRYVLDELRQFHEERNRPTAVPTPTSPWRVLLFTMVLLFLLSFTTFNLIPSILFPAPVPEIVNQETPEMKDGLDLKIIRFIEYDRPA